MNKLNRNFGLSISALLPVLLLSAQGASAQAQDTEPKIYSCKQCVQYTGWRGILDFGLYYVSDDSLRFGDYRGLEEEGYGAAIDGDVHFRDLKGWYFDLYASNLALDSRELDMRGGKQDNFELRFGWQEIPKYRGYGAATPFLGVGSNNLTLPSDWVYAATTDEMTALQSSLAAAKLKTQREILDAGGTVKFGGNWSYKLDYQRQDKMGTRSLGGGIFNSALVPAPVNYTTDIIDTALSWAGKRGQFQLRYLVSSFENKNSSLTWRNPFGSRSVNDYIQPALEPGNDFYQLSVGGAFAFTPRIRLSGQAAWGSFSQNEPFIAYSTNPDYSAIPLPRASLNGKLDTSVYNVSGKLLARLNNRLSFTVRGKFDERENNTPVELYTPIKQDIFPGGPRYNRPYSYEREQYSADLRLRMHSSIRLSGGAGQNNIERSLQAVETSEETSFWGEVKVNPTYSSQLRVKLESADRDVSDYLQPDDDGPVDHPLMRKFNQADRERDRLLLELDLMPLDAFGINLSYFKAEADYTDSQIGLQESVEDSYTINLNYALGSNFNIYAFLTREDIDAKLLNATSVTAVPWTALTSDEVATEGLGMSAHINENMSMGLDLISSEARGDISVQTEADEDPFNPLRTKLRNAKIHFDHEVSENWGYKLYAEYENYKAQDWAIDGLGVDGIGSVLTMGEQSPDYSVWYFRVQASYRF
jgi:MtrB/PioB family decaheme-associated outer membrane protein